MHTVLFVAAIAVVFLLAAWAVREVNASVADAQEPRGGGGGTGDGESGPSAEA